jgi:integrase
MGTVYRRGKKLWIGFSVPGAGPGGRPKWFYRPSGYMVGQELLARRELREIEDRVRAGAADGLLTDQLTVEQFGRSWAGARLRAAKWTNAKLDGQAFVNHLYAAEMQLGGRTVVLGGVPLGQVDDHHVLAWLEHLEAKGLAGRTRASLLSLLNRMFARALREKRVVRNPCTGLERGETPKQVDKDPLWRQGARFTLPELVQLIADPRVPLDRRVFYAIGFLGGLREGEISALRWRSYDPQRRPLGCFSVGASYTRKNKREKTPKSSRPREVPVHPLTAKLLQVWREKGWRQLFGRNPKPEDLIVPNRAGGYVTDLNVSDNLPRDLEVLGLRRRRFHDTKRTFVSLAREAGATPLLRWISHGPTAREMLDVYSSPDWKALCREVLRLKVRVSTGKLVQVLPTKPTTKGGYRVKGQSVKQVTSAQGEIRTRPKGPRPHENARDSVRATGTEGRPAGADCSESTTAPKLRPYRGGMRIEEG